MNAGIKARWLQALRGGEYRQGRMYLATRSSEEKRTPDEFCCLGVLCDLYAKENGVAWQMNPRDSFFDLFSDLSTLPDEVRDWAGISHTDYDGYGNNPFVYHPKYGRRAVAELNDGIPGESDPLTFGEIADLIEAQL